MEVIIQPDFDTAARLVARLIAKALRRNPRLVLGLATGRTMERVYALLADMHKQAGLDFAHCRTFNLDEYVGLPPEDNNSYRFYMDQHLFSKINIDRRNTHLPDGMASDLTAACAQYEQAIRQAGGIDFQLLGIGHDGHIGFNEPLSALRSRTRAKLLAPQTVAANGPLFGDQARMPRRALTMGVGTILDSKRCVLLATGKTKADILAKAVEGPITAMVSASALQLHPHCTIVTDEEAAARLAGQDYYRFIFRNEPEWQEFQ
ncbi:MAG: glucosamine-6-phosphate deaminase [Verrucomicrobiota bacterium]